MFSPERRQQSVLSSLDLTKRSVSSLIQSSGGQIRPRTLRSSFKRTNQFFNENLQLDTEFFNPYRPIMNDQFGESELIKALRTGQKRKFMQLYDSLAADSKVNQFMYNVFVYGKNFNPQLKLPQFLNLIDSSGKNILHYAAAGDINLEEGFFKQLIPKFAGRQDSRGITALMLASIYGNVRAVNQLKQYEAGLQDTNGATALMCAAKYGRNAVVDILLPHEAMIMDKSSFTFIDYLPLSTQESYVQHLNKAMAKFFRDYKIVKAAKIEEKREPPPDYYGFCSNVILENETLEAETAAKIDNIQKLLEANIATDKAAYLEELRQNFTTNVGTQLIQRSQRFLKEFTTLLDNRRELTEDEGAAMESEVLRRVSAAKDDLNDGIERTQQKLRAGAEKLHLVYQYGSYDIYDEFDAVFEKLEATLKTQKDDVLEHLKQFNEITANDATFGGLRGAAQEVTNRYISATAQMIPRLKKRFEDTFQDVHRVLDSTIAQSVNQMKKEVATALNEDQNKLIQIIHYKQVRQIPDQDLSLFKQQIIVEKSNQTLFPDVDTFKMLMNGLYTTMRHSGVVDYQTLVELYQCAQTYLSDSKGLLSLTLSTHIFPSDLFKTYDQLSNYFGVFQDSPYIIKPQQLQSAIQVHLINKYTYKLEEQFVDHIKQYYQSILTQVNEQAIISDEVQEVINSSQLVERQASLSRQRLYNGDQIMSKLDVYFTWFFLCIIGLINRCESVKYVSLKPITGDEAQSNDEFIGTYTANQKAQFEQNGQQKFQCLSLPWMRVQGVQIDVLVDAIWIKVD